jgi:hypothetical protein
MGVSSTSPFQQTDVASLSCQSQPTSSGCL